MHGDAPMRLVTPEADASACALLDDTRAYHLDELMALAAGIADTLAQGRCDGAANRCIVSLGKGAHFFAGLVGCWMAGRVPVLLDPMVRTELGEAVAVTGAGSAVLTRSQADRAPATVTVTVPEERTGRPRDPGAVPPGEPVLFLFTSGTTGRPTLVPKTFGQIDVEVRFLTELFGAPTRVAGLIPWCHIWGLLSSFFVPLRTGGVCDLRGGISARGVLELVAAGELELVAAVPVYYQAMVKLLESRAVAVRAPACRFASASAPLLPVTRAAFEAHLGSGITDIYGSTEAGGIAYRHVDGPWRVQPHVAIRVDGDGMLDVRSPSVSTASEDGFFRTGDLVRRTGGGFVLLGRGDDVVKIGGRRIALGEIERCLAGLKGVGKVAVSTEEVAGTKRLVAYVEKETSDLTGAMVKSHVRRHLADHKVPRVVRFLAELPMTSSGKPDRRRLWSGTTPSVGHPAAVVSQDHRQGDE